MEASGDDDGDGWLVEVESSVEGNCFGGIDGIPIFDAVFGDDTSGVGSGLGEGDDALVGLDGVILDHDLALLPVTGRKHDVIAVL